MNIDLRLGSCIDVMATLPENSVDTIITDPPYHLTSITKRFGGKNAAPAQFGTDGAFARASKGFMGKTWDGGDIAFQVATWEQAYRVLKPGGFLLAFGGTRTYHRMVCAIEDAGFEIRDTIAWVYGSGFPKSYDISKGIDKQAGAEREVTGKYKRPDGTNRDYQGWNESSGVTSFNSDNYSFAGRPITAPSTPSAQLWHGWGTALKPAFEPIVVAMKPIDGTFVNNALTWGVAGLWIDGGRVGTVKNVPASPSDKGTLQCKGLGGGWDRSGMNPNIGRFPANFIHDGSDEVVSGFPQTKSGAMNGVYQNTLMANKAGVRDGKPIHLQQEASEGSAARFFYCAKASRSERNAGLDGTNHHPTIKPIELMRYLVRLTKTPTGGVVLDPFMGSGTTGMACVKEGRNFIGIELDEEYLEIAKKRIEHAQAECTQLSIDNLDEEQSACC